MPDFAIATPQTPRTQRHQESFTDLDNDELTTVLTTLALKTFRDRGMPTAGLFSSAPKPPIMWENAKEEQIICSGLRPLYDGSLEKLISMLNLLNIHWKN